MSITCSVCRWRRLSVLHLQNASVWCGKPSPLCYSESTVGQSGHNRSERVSIYCRWQPKYIKHQHWPVSSHHSSLHFRIFLLPQCCWWLLHRVEDHTGVDLLPTELWGRNKYIRRLLVSLFTCNTRKKQFLKCNNFILENSTNRILCKSSHINK